MLAYSALASLQSSLQAQIPNQIETSNYADKQQVTNPRTGKVERVFVNLEAVYPNPDNPLEEISFEELRARSRGWLSRDWAAKSRQRSLKRPRVDAKEESLPLGPVVKPAGTLLVDGTENDLDLQDNPEEFGNMAAVEDTTRGGRSGRTRKTKVMEVKVETQTSKNLRQLANCAS